MAFAFESLGRDWAISLTDLVLALCALLALNHSSNGKVSIDFNSETNLVGIAFATLALVAFLGFIRWGFVQNNKLLNKTYGHLIEVTKHASIPFLIINLIQQQYVSKPIIFLTLHVLYVLTVLGKVDHEIQHNFSQLLTILPLILLAVQSVITTDFLKMAVVGGFLLVPIVMKQSGVPLFHILMAGLCWILESARIGHYAPFNIPGLQMLLLKLSMMN